MASLTRFLAVWIAVLFLPFKASFAKSLKAGGFACNIDVHKFDSRVHKHKYRFGVFASRGYETAFQEYNKTFAEYLTETAGRRFDPPIEFEMVPDTMQGLFHSLEQDELDFIFVNPGVYSCIGVEYGAQPLATIISHLHVRGHIHNLDVSGGVMFTQADNREINTLSDLKDKVIGAGSISMMMAGQLQFYEMERAGLSYVMDPKQVVFTHNQFDVVEGVRSGRFDVGFVRADTIERSTDADGEPIDHEIFKIIHPKVYIMDDGSLFPFLHSTDIYPEWPVAALPHVAPEVTGEVQQALLSLRGHAMAAEGYRNATDDTPANGSCDTSKEVAKLAFDAAETGHLDGFRTARSYFDVRTMQEAAGILHQDEWDIWKCSRSDTLYESIECPAGHYKLDETSFMNSCDDKELACEEGYDCYCQPCVRAFEVDVYECNHPDDYVHIIRHDIGCDKMSVCGIVEQTKEIQFRIRDNKKRDNAEISVKMHLSDETFDVPVIKVENEIYDGYNYKFLWSNNGVGVGIMEVFVNGEQIPESPIRVQVVERQCEIDYPGHYMVADENGNCICKAGTLDIGGKCLSTTVLAVVVSIAFLILVVGVGFCLVRYKTRKSDQMWMVNVEELHFDDPVEVIGQGSFGVVLLAEYRGTKVAIKQAIKNKCKRNGSTRGSKSMKVSPGTSSAGNHTTDYTGSVGMSSGVGSEISQDTGDLEDGLAGSQGSPVSQVSNGFGKSTNPYSLAFLAEDFGEENKWVWLFPWMKKNDYHSRFKESILGASSASMSKKSLAARLCPWFNEQAQREEDFLAEMRILSRLRHPCITTVLGAVVSRSHEPMLVMEYMEYGSLHDLLRNETMYLSGEIILQVTRDVAQGLRYLHSSKPPILHGDLKARNILVDSRFRAKLCDFGLSTKRNNLITGTPFWLAPEYLRGQAHYNTHCDMYSVGIILYEIYSRKAPYEGEDFRTVLRKVCDRRVNKRPVIPETCPTKMADLMKKCWSQDPFFRPQAKDLDMTLMDMNTQDAEPLTAEQSNQQIMRGEKRTGDMLYELFPRHIADALKAGQKVEAETHELVTVVFSDIIRFTDISREVSPMKVSTMLDRLYHAFDRIARKHQVFKVETIGDAYMGVTNLENNQADTHVKHAAEFAIDMIYEASKILIDEEAPEKGCINIRVGFHSGTVVSNVIGSLNPRYGLFGDTVNTASRMESNSKANRILCSEKSYQLLKEQAPEMPVRRRGKITVKGKGDMNVFWVGGPLVSFQGTPAGSHDTASMVNEAKTEKEEDSKKVGFEVDASESPSDVALI